MRSFQRMLQDEAGATMVEYGLIIAIIGLGCFAAWSQLWTGMAAEFGTMAKVVQTPPH